MARLAWGRPGYRPDQHVRVHHRLIHTVAGTRAQQPRITFAPRYLYIDGAGEKSRHRDRRVGRNQSRNSRLQRAEQFRFDHHGLLPMRLWIRSPGIPVPPKVAGNSFLERTAMSIGLDPATAAAADPPLDDATTPRDVAVLRALRNVHECRIAARS